MQLVVKEVNKKMTDYKKVKRLYKASFPFRERIPMIRMKLRGKQNCVTARAYYDNDIFLGFSFVIERETVAYIAYLAVQEELRGRGYGTEMLKCIKAQYPDKVVFLDLEAPNPSADNANEREKRLAFYLRNGFYDTKYIYSIDGVEYDVMATDASFTANDYRGFWRGLYGKQ